ncbi:hypothetical protein [Rhodophyticola sp.]|uniref:hypothetical protein n=1 Tax=Rhodophyticola sp. TaxID=2680032 RepID=UPI003D2DCF0C
MEDAARSNTLYIGATGAIHRNLIDKFSEIELKHSYEDLVLGFRAALLGKTHHVRENLVAYRYQVGMSSVRFSKITTAEKVKSKLRTLTTYLDVMKQRQTDLAHIKPDQAALREVLRVELAHLSAKHANLSLVQHAVSSPVGFVLRNIGRPSALFQHLVGCGTIRFFQFE